MPTLQRSPSHSQEHLPAPTAPSAQLPLPTGPLGVVRRERSSEDRLWYNEQLSVQHEKLIDRSVFQRMAFFGSLNPERIAFPAVARLAREALCSERSARYALRRLESSGLVECVFPGRGRSTSQYLVVGTSCRTDLQDVQVRPAPVAPNVLKEGNKRSSKDLAFKDKAKSIDPEEKEVNLSLFPSLQEQKQEKAPVPKKQKKPVVFSFEAMARKWFKLMRKLGRYCDDTMALAFDKKPHREKTSILNDLEAVEQEQVYLGRMDAPPLTRPRGFLTAGAEEAQRLAACAHVPADDLPVACAKCGSYIGGAA